MKNQNSIGLVLLLTTALMPTANAGFFDGLFGKAAVNAHGIMISDGVTDDQSKKITEDLDFLNNLTTLSNADADTVGETARILKVDLKSRTIGSDLLVWLKERVSYIVGEDYELVKNLKVVEESQKYPQNEAPIIEKSTKTPTAGGTVKTVMSNIGAAVYYAGKDSKSLLGLEINGDEVPVKSPRTGVIQVGEGLFSKSKVTKGLDDNSVVTRVMRLETFFHEARHSDGHGASLGFFHAPCPEGHPYGGYSACDRNLNGPYTVGNTILKVMKAFCQSSIKCSDEEIVSIDLALADSASRVILTVKNPAASGIIAEINAYKTLREVCRTLPDLPTCTNLDESIKKSGLSESDFEQILRDGVPNIPTQNWDDAPEGV